MVPKHAGSLFRVLFFSLALVCVLLFMSKGSGAAILESVGGTPSEIKRAQPAVLQAWGGSAGSGAGAWRVRAEVPGAGRKQRRWRREAQVGAFSPTPRVGVRRSRALSLRAGWRGFAVPHAANLDCR